MIMKKKKEIEIKIELKKNELSVVKKSLKELGAIRSSVKKETTYGFFSPNSIQVGIFPRIKKYKGESGGLLTVKVKKILSSKYFQREELTMTVSDVKAARDILKILGYTKERIFDKIRENWTIPGKKIEIAIDELPFGFFLEIEGSPQGIERMIELLGLSGKERIVKAYLRVYDDWRRNRGIKKENCVFRK